MHSLKKTTQKEINYRHITYTSSSSNENNDLNDYRQNGQTSKDSSKINSKTNYLNSHSSGYNSGNPTGSYSSYSTNAGNEKVYSSSSGIYATGSNYDLPKDEFKEPQMVNDELLAQQVLSKCGPSFTYQRKDYLHDIGSLHERQNKDNCHDSTNSTINNQLNTTVTIKNSNNTKTQQHNNIYQDINTTTNSESNDEIINSNKNTSVNESKLNKTNNDLNETTTSNLQEQQCNVNIIKIDPSPALYSASSVINQDPDPIRIVKPNNQNIIYKQQVNIRYLQPPTPPPPAPIIIREKQLSRPAPQPPIIIRQTAPPPPTPPPLTIREKAPTPPPILEPTIIERPVPAPPPPPRQVIIERVPAPPPKPRPIIYEKWLPYKSTKRPVIVQKVKPQPPQAPPKNVIIEYEKPKAVAIRQVIEEGIFRVDPATYESQMSQTNGGEVRVVDRITDLPIESSRILAQLSLDSNSRNYTTSVGSVNSNKSTDSNVYAQFLSQNHTNFSNSEENDNITNEYENNLNHLNETNKSNIFETNGYYSSANPYSTYSTSQPDERNSPVVEYETITTCVPESLAAKIIAEAQAAGAITKSSKCNLYHCNDILNTAANKSATNILNELKC